MSTENLHEGHRQRMIERLVRGDRLEDHELLEIMLYFVLPRVNTNNIAHTLIESFGSFTAVFEADPKALSKIEGVGKKSADIICLFAKILGRLREYQEDDIPSTFNYGGFIGFLQDRYKDARQEYAELFAIKKNGDVYASKRFTSGDAFFVNLPPMEVIQFIADYRPTHIILTHNHLSKTARPSESDNRTTQFLCLLLSLLNVKLIDHVIVSPGDVFSYLNWGQMATMHAFFDAEKVLELCRTKMNLSR